MRAEKFTNWNVNSNWWIHPKTNKLEKHFTEKNNWTICESFELLALVYVLKATSIKEEFLNWGHCLGDATKRRGLRSKHEEKLGNSQSLSDKQSRCKQIPRKILLKKLSKLSESFSRRWMNFLRIENCRLWTRLSFHLVIGSQASSSPKLAQSLTESFFPSLLPLFINSLPNNSSKWKAIWMRASLNGTIFPFPHSHSDAFSISNEVTESNGRKTT